MKDPRNVETLLNAQTAVASALALASDPVDAIRQVLHIVCDACEWTSGICWRADGPAGGLEVHSRWSGPSSRASDDHARAAAERAFATHAPAWDDDRAPHSYAVPVLVRSEARGALTFDVASPDSMNETTSAAIQSVGLHVGMFLEHGADDLSNRKRSEAESETMRALIERSAREWQRTLDVISFPILLVDGDASILRLNRTARDQLLAASYGDVIGQRLDEVGGSEPWTSATSLVRSMVAEPAGGSRNLSVVASRRAWDVEATIWTRANVAESRIVLLVRDVTATVRLQESLRRTETMATIGAVVASVAHEVRTPLFSIGATVDAFEAEFGKHHEEFAEYHGVLRRQVDRLSKLMEDLLEYGKPLSIVQSVESVNELVDTAVADCADTAARRDVRVDVRLAADLPNAHVDRARAIQVLQNLIVNAIQYSPPHAVVEVVVKAVSRSDGDWIVCRVLDSGPGFDERDLGRVFEPFFTKRPGGTGLGLSIVQRIVDHHGGAVHAENRTRGGACLTVLFPQEPDGEVGA